jgi:hypothetical protein
MRQFTYVEDYLEVIVGHRDPVSGQLLNQWVADIQPIINLARYDVNVLESMALAVEQKQALTERQGELLVKIVLKYERQLLGQGVDVEPARQPVWRIPLRKMDYSCSLTRDGDRLLIRFPFNNDIIGEIRDFSKTSQGEVRWDRDRRVWTAAVTEYNVSWLAAWAAVNQFDIDPAVAELMNLIHQVESTPYAIELYIDGDQLGIRNSPDSLREYIQAHGGFGLDRLLYLVDMSPVLGYSVEPAIMESIVATHGARFYNLLVHRELRINPAAFADSNDFDVVLDYAEAVGRGPVVVYEPNSSNRMLKQLQQRVGTDEVFKMQQYIHTQQPLVDRPIGLLISSAGMVFGADRQQMLHQAEKVVYVAQEVYNKKNNSRIKRL